MRFCPQRLKYWRHIRRMKQEALADEAGLDRSTISRYETGSLLPQRYQIELLAKALKVEDSDLAPKPNS